MKLHFVSLAIDIDDDDESDNFYTVKITPQGRFTKTLQRIYQISMFLTVILNESSAGISVMLSGRLFQAVCPATQKARSPNLAQDDRLGRASITPDVDADRCADQLSLMTSGKQRSAMQSGAIP